MNCEKMNDLMSAWLDGELTQAEELEMKEHLNICPECQAVFEQLKGLHTSFSDLEELEPSADFTDKVLARIEAESGPKVVSFPKTRSKNRRVWQSVAALAACAVLAIGIGNKDSLMGGGAAAPAAPAAPAPEAAMMAPDMVKGMNGMDFDVPAAAESEPAEGAENYSMTAEAPAPAPHAEEWNENAAKQESAATGDGAPIYRPAQPEAGAEREWQAAMDSKYEFLLDALPEGVEEAVGLLVWEVRPFDGARYARLTLEQGELLQKLLEESGLSFTQRMVHPHGTENVLICLPQ